MNHIFKNIWSEKLGQMVVVSEHAKSAGKSDNTTGSVTLESNQPASQQGSMSGLIFQPLLLKSLVLCMAAISGANAWAGLVCETTGTGSAVSTATGTDAIACGVNNTASGFNSIAMGTLNTASGAGSAAVGSGLAAHQSERYTYTIKELSFEGFKIVTNLPDNVSAFTSELTPEMIVSINGQSNLSDAAKQVFVSYIRGSINNTKLNSAAGIASSAIGVINNASGLASSAVGFKNIASGDASSAYGASNTASGSYSSVFGSNSQAKAEGATAIGNNSLADEANTISVGRAGAEKRITNVATPTKATDAANKGYVDTQIAAIPAVKYYSVNSTLTGTGSNANNDGATGADSLAVGVRASASGDYSSAVGYNNTASGSQSSAVGYDNTASGDSSSAIGLWNRAFGENSSATGLGNSTFGKMSSAAGVGGAAIGSGSAVMGGALMDYDPGQPPQLVNNISGRIVEFDPQTNQLIKIDGLDIQMDDTDPSDIQWTLGGKNITQDEMNGVFMSTLAGGAIAVGEQAQAIGSRSTAFGDKATAIGAESKAYADNSVALGAGAVADEANTVSVGKAGAEKRITNVKAGTNTTDAVNKGQLDLKTDLTIFSALDDQVNDANTGLATKASQTDLTALDGRVTTNEGNITTNINNISALDGRVGTAENSIGTLQTDLGTANSNISTLQTDLSTTNSNVSALDGRVSTAETNIGNLQTDLGTANTTIGVLDTRLGTAETSLATAQSNITSLDGRVGTNETAITNIGTRIDGVDSTVARIDGQVTTNTNDILGLKTGLGTVANAVIYDNATKNQITLAGGANGTTISNLKAGADDGDAVNFAQLKTTNTNVNTAQGTADTALTTAQKGLKVRANTKTEDTLALGDTLTFANGTNTKVDYDATSNTFKTNLVDAPVFSGQVQAASFKTGSVVVDGSSNKISGVADGQVSATSNEVVTGKQLHTVDSRITTEVGALNNHITTEVGTINDRIDGVDTRINGVDRTVAAIDDRVTINESDIANLQSGLGGLSGNAVIYDSAAKDQITLAGQSGTKLSNLQDATLSTTSTDAVTGRQLQATNDTVATKAAQADLSTTNSNLTTLNNQVNDASTGLATKASQTDLNTVTGRVDTAEADISALDGRVGSNETKLTTLDSRVTTTTNHMLTSLGGGAAITNGQFVAPSYQIQNKAYRDVGSAFTAVDQSLDGLNDKVSSLSQQATTNLADAKDYTDQKAASALNDAKGYTDQKTADTRTYVDQQTANTLTDAKDYTDQKSAATLADAKSYSDQQAVNTLTDAKSYADQKSASTLADAKGYTDQKADSTLASAKGYTDQQVDDIKNTMDAKNKLFSVNGAGNGQDNAAQATGAGAIAIGDSAQANGSHNTVIGAGATATGESNTVVGKGNKVQGNASGAFGDPNVVNGNASYAVGNDNTITADNTFVLGNNVNTSAKNAVVLGNDSAAERDNTVSVGATGKERQVIHVAAGVEDTDAVNVKQMNSSKAEAVQTAQTYTDSKLAVLNDSLQNYQYQNERRFGKINERFDRQGAMTAAMMSMATSTSGLQGQNRIGVGAGVQGSEQAVSVGYQRVISNNASISVGGAFTQDESSGGVGVGFSW